MKSILPTLIAAAALVWPAAAQQANQADALWRQGQAAEKTGNVAAARKAYTEALRANPNHAGARYSLGQLRLNEQSIAARGRERKFGAVVVPEVRFDQATLAEALDFLGKVVEKESNEDVTPNFIIQDPAGKIGEQTVTLNIKNVPARTILKYLTDQTGTRARYDEHAIIIERHPGVGARATEAQPQDTAPDQ